MDFSSILLYGALGVFAVLLLVILIPLVFSLMNKSDKSSPALQKKEYNHQGAQNTRTLVDQDRSVSGQFVMPDKNPPPARRKTTVTDVPRHTREQYIEHSQPQPKNYRKNWQNHWR